jgi:transposase-like protein
MALSKRKRALLTQHWQRQVAEWAESGLSRRAFARQRGICASNLASWCRRLSPGPRGSEAVETAGLVAAGRGLERPAFSVAAREPEQADVSGTRLVPVPGHLVWEASKAAGDGPGDRDAPGGLTVVVGRRRYGIRVPVDFLPAHLARVVQTLEGLE